jgi:hypothetical protein
MDTSTSDPRIYRYIESITVLALDFTAVSRENAPMRGNFVLSCNLATRGTG